MALSAALLAVALAARRQAAADRSLLASWVGLSLFGFAGSLTHFYVFLEVGLIYLWLLATIPRTAFRIGIVLSGLAIAGVELVDVHALLHATQQNIHHMWFRADALFFFNQVTVCWHNAASYTGLAAAIILALETWRRRRDGPPAPAGRKRVAWSDAGRGPFPPTGATPSPASAREEPVRVRQSNWGERLTSAPHGRPGVHPCSLRKWAIEASASGTDVQMSGTPPPL
jgi:hypothetical protein